ncbi:hypothetical protein LS684_20005 [Cytobacillus spongiae]|uniref:hypothetical protein n=1 Tax=Cytobacillus spongiae TaxID=2901381 RepID=UPI001F29A8E7|nr:hypothetical protein [Cytobacillus spongiae]UII55875.1 hypothetical protein LS684_20005 [Cytobacillus spongiae]
MFVTIFFTVVLSIPIFGFALWTLYFPEESILLGRRWMYKEKPEISKAAIQYTKFAALITMAFYPFLAISIIFEIHILRLVFILYPLILLIGKFFIFINEN